jgi:hypothetical protein
MRAERSTPKASQPRGRPGGVGGDDPAGRVGVAAEVLRRAVQHQRRALGGGVLQHWRREGVVDHHRDRTCLRDHLGDVHERERRVLRRLEDDRDRVGTQRGCDFFRARPAQVEPEQPGRQQMGSVVP